MRTLIIDDEPPARARLRRLLAEVPDCELVGEAASARQAQRMIDELEPDLLLLDISMPGVDGMQLAASLKAAGQAPAVVFCTAWPDQALEAFDRDAVDYLVKPVRLERLQSAIDKAARMKAGRGVPAGFLRSTVGGRTTLISLADVICLIAEDKYTTVIYTSGTTVINDSLVDLEKRFSDHFLRIHRNALVAPAAVRGLERAGSGSTLLVLEGTGFKPEVSRRNLAAVRKYLREIG